MKKLQPSIAKVLTHINDAIILISPDNKVIEFNQASEKLLGITRKKIIDKNLFSVCKQSGVTLPFDFTALQTLTTENQLFFNNSIPHLDKPIVHLQWECFYLREGKEAGCYLLIAKVLPKGLGDNETYAAYLKNIIESLPQYIYWKDKNFVYQGCNEYVAQDLKLKSPDDIVGKTDHDFGWSKERIQALKEADTQVVKEGLTLAVEEVIPKIDGTSAIMLSSKTPMKNKKGEIIGLLGVSTDVTYLKNLEEELKQKNVQVENALKSRSEFLSVMGHQLGNPINGIVGSVGIIKRSLGHDNRGEIPEFLENIREAAMKILGLFQSVSDYMELDSGGFKSKFSPLHLAADIEQIISSIKFYPGVKCLVEFDKDVPKKVSIDDDNLGRILQIIIGNAARFTQKGSITLQVSRKSGNDAGSSMLTIAVKDTGPGISKEQQSFIFKTFIEPYEHTETSRYRKTGVKLPMAKKIAELMGGSLTVKSALSKGTTVFIDVPYKELEDAVKRRIPDIISVSQEDYTNEDLPDYFPLEVLLVEDEPVNLKIESDILTPMVKKLVCAKTGKEAIKAAKRKEFDVIFMDIGLPDTSGVDVAIEIRPFLAKKTEMVAVTSHAKSRDRDKYLKVGFVTVLPKPVSQDDFKRFLAAYMHQMNEPDDE